MTSRVQGPWFRRRGRPDGRPCRAPWFVAGLLTFVPAAFADAPPPPPFEGVVPSAEGFAFDGKVDEKAWSTALLIPAEPLEGGPTPEVKVLTGGGCLWVSAKVAEDPGFAMGIRWLIAPEKTASAADCVALSYSPQDTRCPEFTVRGPRGAGRKVYRFDGRADVSQAGVWTIETCLALADLALPAADTPLRLAVAVTGRTPNRLSCAPPDSAFQPPSAFALVRSPPGGWKADEDAGLVGLTLSNHDATDAERIDAWRDFLSSRAERTPSNENTQSQLTALGRAKKARPDLLAVALWRSRAARESADPALRGSGGDIQRAASSSPGFRELRWEVERREVDDVVSPVPNHTVGDGYAGAFSEAEELTKRSPTAGSIATGLLKFRHGDFDEALRLLEPLGASYAFDEEIAATARHAKEWAQLWGQELARRRSDRADLPRATIWTKDGKIIVELFEEDAPNTVKNFVWLATNGAMDAKAEVSSVRPFQGLVVETGLPHPWAIPLETNKRKPFRGSLQTIPTSTGEADARMFSIASGTLPEVDGRSTIFGRVIEGQDVVDRLWQRGPIEKVEIVRKRPGVEYRPITVAGTPAPPPK